MGVEVYRGPDGAPILVHRDRERSTCRGVDAMIDFLKRARANGAVTVKVASETKPVPTIGTDSTRAVERQIALLSQYIDHPNLATRTTYYGQRDNYSMPHRTCNSSANAMYCDWLLRVTGKRGFGVASTSDDEFLQAVLSYGDTIYHLNQTKALAKYGFETKWMVDGNLQFVEDLVKAGFPVVVNIKHRGTLSRPHGGHVILLIGITDEWIAHDPYGTLSSNYARSNGAYSRIDFDVFKRRWQGGYRVLA